jgi:hypothetical protein
MRNKLILGIFLFILVFPLTSALTLYESGISEEVHGGYVKITWATDEMSDSIVYFGVGSTSQQKAGGNHVKEHIVFVDDLEDGNIYDYYVKSCTETECKESSLRQFSFIKPDIKPPILEYDYFPLEVIEPILLIEGKVDEPVIMTSIVNDEEHTSDQPYEGDFSLSVNLQDGENEITIKAVDLADHEVSRTFYVTAHLNPVTLIDTNLNNISGSTSETQTITGQVDKPFVDIYIYIKDEIFEVQADADGKFSLEVTLGSDEITNIIIRAVENFGGNLSRETDLIQSGLEIIQCGEGNWWKVRVSESTPQYLTPEHLLNGVAQIGFKIEMDYFGGGSNPRMVFDPIIDEYPTNDVEKVIFHEDLIGNTVVQCIEDKTECYVIMNLNQWPGSKQELYDATSTGIDLLNSVRLPLMLTLQFTHDMSGETSEPIIQDQCWSSNIMLDPRIYDNRPMPRLNTTINFLNNTINGIGDIREVTQTAQDVATVGCVATAALEIPFLALHKAKCNLITHDSSLIAEANFKASLGEENCDIDPDSDSTECQDCLDAIISLRSMTQTKNLACDRIFCPPVPTMEKHAKEYNDFNTKLNSSCREGSNAPGCEKEYRREYGTINLFGDEYAKATGNQTGLSGNIDKIFQEANQMCPAKQEFPEQFIKVEDQLYLITEDKEVYKAYEVSPAEKTEDTYTIGLNRYADTIGDALNDTEIPELIKEVIEYESYENKEFIFDPTSDIFSASSAMCIPAIDGYLGHWENILEASKQCFEMIMISGEATSGICNELISQYVCDTVWDTVRCLGGATATVLNEQKADDKLRDARKTGADIPLSQSISGSISNRYGNTGAYNNLFNDRKLLHSGCMFFFTGDIPAGGDFQGMLESKFDLINIESRGFLFPVQRRFITSNPLNHGWATYIYDMGYALQAGADLTYTLKLKCSSDLSCMEADFKMDEERSGECDCFQSGQVVEKVIDQGSLSNGELLDEEIYIRVEDKVRFDKAILEWTYTDNTGNQKSDKIITDISLQGANPSKSCGFSTLYNEYRCAVIVGKGTAYFGPQISQTASSYGIGSLLSLEGDVLVEINPEKPLPKYLTVEVFDDSQTLNKVVMPQEIHAFTSSGSFNLESLDVWNTISAEMLRDEEGNCEDKTFSVVLDLHDTFVNEDLSQVMETGPMIAQGQLQHHKIQVPVKCQSEDGSSIPELVDFKVSVGIEDNGNIVPSNPRWSALPERLYLIKDSILFWGFEVNADKPVSISIIVDDQKDDTLTQNVHPSEIFNKNITWAPKFMQGSKLDPFDVQFKISYTDSDVEIFTDKKTVMISLVE